MPDDSINVQLANRLTLLLRLITRGDLCGRASVSSCDSGAHNDRRFALQITISLSAFGPLPARQTPPARCRAAADNNDAAEVGAQADNATKIRLQLLLKRLYRIRSVSGWYAGKTVDGKDRGLVGCVPPVITTARPAFCR